MRKVVFSSDQIPAHPDERVRLKRWRDFHAEHYGSSEIDYATDRPLAVRYDVAPFDGILVTRQTMTARRYARRAADIAADPRHDFLIAFNRAASAPTLFQRGRELRPAAGQPVFCTNAEPFEARAPGEMALVGVSVPRARLTAYLTHADDRLLTPFDPSNPAVRLLSRYAELVLDADDVESDAALNAHVETTLIDLVALALGANGETAETAGLRGLRAARQQAILSAIRSGFADPAFSAEIVALKLGVTARYVQNLLQDSGTSFTARVMELRLNKARTMLTSPGHRHLKISEIAYACGFNEISYFNRAFRRRFGDTPGSFRRG